MPHDPILHLLGLAKKAGRLEIGEEPVGAAARAHQARVLLLAADAAPNTVRRAAHFGESGGALWLQMPFTKAELGAAGTQLLRHARGDRLRVRRRPGGEAGRSGRGAVRPRSSAAEG